MIALLLACAADPGKETAEPEADADTDTDTDTDTDADADADVFRPEEGRWKVTSSEVSDSTCGDLVVPVLAVDTRVDLAMTAERAFTLAVHDTTTVEVCAFDGAGSGYDCDALVTAEGDLEITALSSGLFQGPMAGRKATAWTVTCTGADCDASLPCTLGSLVEFEVY